MMYLDMFEELAWRFGRAFKRTVRALTNKAMELDDRIYEALHR